MPHAPRGSVVQPAEGDSAMPKSITFTWPSAPTRMFEGLRSRWMKPDACAWAMASVAVRMSPMRSRSARPRAASVMVEAPATCSIAIQVTAPSVPLAWMVAMAGWRSSARVSGSRSAATRALALVSAWMSLRATSRAGCCWRARQTSPMPPRPMGSTRVNPPIVSPAAKARWGVGAASAANEVKMRVRPLAWRRSWRTRAATSGSSRCRRSSAARWSAGPRSSSSPKARTTGSVGSSAGVMARHRRGRWWAPRWSSCR